MTHLTDRALPDELLEQIADQGLDVLLELIRTVINTAMKIERQHIFEQTHGATSQILKGAVYAGQFAASYQWLGGDMSLMHQYHPLAHGVSLLAAVANMTVHQVYGHGVLLLHIDRAQTTMVFDGTRPE
jgi:hypothetical protein